MSDERDLLARLREAAGLPTTEARLDELLRAFQDARSAAARLRAVDVGEGEPAPTFRALGRQAREGA